VVNNGEIAAVIIEDESTLKRMYYYPDAGKLVLNAEIQNMSRLSMSAMS
jgi:repressor LexA